MRDDVKYLKRPFDKVERTVQGIVRNMSAIEIRLMMLETKINDRRENIKKNEMGDKKKALV